MKSNQKNIQIRVPPVIGKYNVVENIGKGDFAQVVLAIDPKTNEKVAIKIVNREAIVQRNILLYLENELRLTCRFNHPSIVKVLDVIYEPDIIMIIMEYYPQGDLQTVISRGVHFSVEDQLRISQQILEGLKYLHKRGVCHRDIKPENILFDDEMNPKIIDFGFSKENSAMMHTFCGTPFFIAPEIVTQNQYDGTKADVWAFGVTAHILACGKLPWVTDNGMQLIKDMQEGKLEINIEPMGIMGSMIRNALIVDPQERLSSDQLLSLINESKRTHISISNMTLNSKKNSAPVLPHIITKHHTSSGSMAKILTSDRFLTRMQFNVKRKI
ncbi:CAMK family protein kinase [Trichomonas vaginalis G3]|uniref:CAMK family protein kinase n=1 Tax=Trichomonas vaginalis (strain ATCC PRA-98 / G3) TaxID=412133 RepID=A2G1L3_TRIV3|nr:protein serine/threonine kinase protein [Trichomonas vaginalis G3]EAX88952.1 CAMK family protein kinase [Trichomonas vaginalis G3]KAI5507984.1 protein serine/threonine kinase protein [Trichomonas vaginalis G3]|eukprot:XP_001301882.1 CAMK family protein kinase [Trichomonas vaginalis G3]